MQSLSMTLVCTSVAYHAGSAISVVVTRLTELCLYVRDYLLSVVVNCRQGTPEEYYSISAFLLVNKKISWSITTDCLTRRPWLGSGFCQVTLMIKINPRASVTTTVQCLSSVGEGHQTPDRISSSPLTFCLCIALLVVCLLMVVGVSNCRSNTFCCDISTCRGRYFHVINIAESSILKWL